MKELIPNRVFEILRTHWEDDRVIAPVITVIYLFFNYFFGEYELSFSKLQFDYKTFYVSSAILIVVFMIWVYKNKLPHRRRNKFLILLAIVTEQEEEHNRIINDFLHHLNEVITRTQLIDSDIKTLSNYHSQRACSNVMLYHKITGAHLILFGNCTQRISNSENKYVLNLHASVIHEKIPVGKKIELKSEMREVFPHETIFSKVIEFEGFRVSSELIGYASEYIMGLAALMSRDPFSAIEFHNHLSVVSGLG